MVNPRASLPGLPVELQELIFLASSPESLASLGQTCRAFYELTEKIIYASVLIHEGKMGAFAAVLDRYSHRKRLVMSLDVDYRPKDDDDSIDEVEYSACTFAPLFVEFSNLQSLTLSSACWYYDDSLNVEGHECANNEEMVDKLHVNWLRDQERLDEAFRLAGLLAPPHQRIWQQLRTITLDFWDSRAAGGCFFFWDPSIFLIDTLHHLIMRNMHFGKDDGEELAGSDHRGTTQLKTLTLERSAIHHIALQRFLSMPRGLTHLTLQHNTAFETHKLGDRQNYSTDFLDWDRALDQQRESLEFMHIDKGPWTREQFLETLRKYPRLKLFEVYTRDSTDCVDERVGYAGGARCEIRSF